MPLPDPQSDSRDRQPPFEQPELPQTGEEILREVERLKNKPPRFQCLGMSLTGILLMILLIVAIVMFFR
jgi:hypothetical protein